MTKSGRALDFADRYQITSVRGRVYSYEMLARLAVRRLRSSPLPLAAGGRLADLPRGELLAYVNAVLRDDKFMSWRRGMIPARLAAEIEHRVWKRAGGFR